MLEQKEMYVPLVRTYAVREKKVLYKGEKVNSPEKVMELANEILKNVDREYLLALSIDSQSEPVALEIVSIGTIDYAVVEPREVLKHGLLANAAGLIIVHNHPGGSCIPSKQDKKVTERMKKAGELIGIPLQDHVIVGDGYFSFAESGML